MAKIYISYSKTDREFALRLSEQLRAFGHQISLDVETLAPGQDWRTALSDALKQADVVLGLISENSVKSQFVFSEIGSARAYAEINGSVLVIPILIDNVSIPGVVADLYTIFAADRDIDAIVVRVDAAIAAFLGKRAAQEKAASERKEQVETNATIYIEDAILWLRTNATRDRRIGTIWSIVGFVALLVGIGFGFRNISQAIQAQQFEWVRFAYVALKSVIVIGLLLACCKYAFTFGKTYMAESLKSADRIHAISFGKFYLRAYGDKAQWAELKEVFQHWNVDRVSAFSGLDTSQFDPKFADFVTEIAKAAATLRGK